MAKEDVLFAGRRLSDNRFQTDALDGLRGAAALIVFLSHTSNHGKYFLPNFNFTGIGKSGVWLFFVLSAFLLTSQFIEKQRTAFSREALFNYSLRRVFRIYPLYIFYLLIALLTSLFWYRLTGAHRATGIPFLLTPIQFLQQATFQSGFGVTWSILAEVRYYLVLPFVALFFIRIAGNRLLPSVVFIGLLFALSEYFWPQSAAQNNSPELGQYLPVFLMGSLLALLHHHWRLSPMHERPGIKLALELAGFAAIAVVLLLMPSVKSFLFGGAIDPSELHTQYALYGLLWSMLLFACLNGHGLIRGLFELKPLRYLGFISFSFYLWQDTYIEHLPRLVGDLPFLAWLILGATVATSHVTYILIERPFSRVRYGRPSLSVLPAAPEARA